MNRTEREPRGGAGWWLRWFALTLMLGLAAAASDAGQLESSGIERHGWAVLLMGEGFALVHLPPREEVAGSEGLSARADDGELTLVKELRERPEVVVSAGRTVFLFFESKVRDVGEPVRAVLSVTARPTPIGSRWATDSSGRLAARAGLTGKAEIIDAVGFRFTNRSEDRCAVLLEDAGGTAIDLRVLDGSVWASLPLPPGLNNADQVRLVESESGVLLIARTDDGSNSPGWIAWRGSVTEGVTTLQEPTDAPGESPVSVRSLPTVEWEDAGEWPALVVEDGSFVFELAGAILSSSVHPENGWIFRTSRGSEVFKVVSRQMTGQVLAVVATGRASGTRLVVIERADSAKTTDANKGESAEAQKLRGGAKGLVSSLRLIEVSAATGRVLYEGPALNTPVLSINEFWLIGLMAVAAVVGVLVFVILPDPDRGVVLLPAGTALAEPFRRVAATSADVAGAMLLASWSLGEFADAGLIQHTEGDLWTLAAMLAFAFMHGALGEWAFGRTVGKVLLGCKVVGTRVPGKGRVGLRAALLRNVVKFAMPPVAFLGLTDANARHRGDVLAGTAVVISVGDDPDEREADESDSAFTDDESDDESDED